MELARKLILDCFESEDYAEGRTRLHGKTQSRCSRANENAKDCLASPSSLRRSTSACAAWPEKPIKVLIGYAPGGSTDVVARLLAPKLGEKLGQPIIIENKPGGAGDFAAELMLQAPRRRLHAHDDHGRGARDQPGPHEAEVRPDQRLHADRVRLLVPDDHDRVAADHVQDAPRS